MKSKPLKSKYDFSSDVLSMDIQDHLRRPLANWVFSILCGNQKITEEFSDMIRPDWFLTDSFHESLQVELREVFPQKYNDFISHIFNNDDTLLTILQWCLNYYAMQKEANDLEWALCNGGSGYSVIKTEKDASEYTKGVYDLVERVPAVIKEASKEAVSSEKQLNEAWILCYGRKPDYAKVVQKTQNVLEEVLKHNYLPNDEKPTLNKQISSINDSAKIKMSYKGSKYIKDAKTILNLLPNIAEHRDMHTAGNGKTPTKDFAEYVLFTSIYIWNLHNGVENANK